jgi:hypothetical protein
MLVVDGEPQDRPASVLIEAVKVSDPGLPIVFVRHGWDRSPTLQNGVHVYPGPLVGRPVQQLLLQLLAATRG